MLFVRHAWAGHRNDRYPDDHLRPLDARGQRQAAELVRLLERYTIDAILTSPYTRSVQTVEPLAAARGLELELRDELTEELQYTEGHALVRACAGRDIVICGHGGLQDALLDPPQWKKGAVFVLGPALEIVDRFVAR